MGIFDIFKKKEIIIPEGNFLVDRMDNYYDEAVENYCDMYKTRHDDLTSEQKHDIMRYASTHIGFFIAWVIKNGFIGDIHRGSDEADKVKSEMMCGDEFILKCCDGKLTREDLSEEIVSFVVEYYMEKNRYVDEYRTWVLDDKFDIPGGFIGTWQDYYEFKHVIDEAYDEFLKRRN